jgi:hypothetical protein
MGLEGLVSKRRDRPYQARAIEALDQGEEPEASGDGGIQMTTLARLLAQKQQLTERLQENPGPQEREEIERVMEKIDTALHFLNEAGPGTSTKETE